MTVTPYRRRTRIICTIGPATGTTPQMAALLKAGMNIARLNLSHGTLNDHAGYLENLRRACERTGLPAAVLIDLPGPKYRIGRLKDGQVWLRKTHLVRLTEADIEGDDAVIPVTLPGLAKNIRRNDNVLLDDGALRLKVREVQGEDVICRVVVGGFLRQGKGLVVPGMKIPVPFMTDRLRESILFAVRHNPDYLALSFVTCEQDIMDVRAVLQENSTDIPIISKIERAEAVRHFTSILAASDGIMIARGDLGVEMPLEQVPLIQKNLILRCNRAGKPVITATEMLESMVQEARPTRAEANDVANAIFDGTDAVMLSAETSIGKHPVQAVSTMARIAVAAEKALHYDDMLAERRDWLEPVTDELISFNACQTAYSLKAAAIVAFTQSGSTAMRISKYRPSVPILALSPNDDILGRLLLYWGIQPIKITEPGSVDGLFALGARLAREKGIARPGDIIIISAGIPIGETGTTNMLKVERIPD